MTASRICLLAGKRSGRTSERRRAAAPAPTDAFFCPLLGSLGARRDAALVHHKSRRLPTAAPGAPPTEKRAEAAARQKTIVGFLNDVFLCFKLSVKGVIK